MTETGIRKSEGGSGKKDRGQKREFGSGNAEVGKMKEIGARKLEKRLQVSDFKSQPSCWPQSGSFDQKKESS